MPGADSVDLRTTYLGLELSSPIVASASPLTKSVDGAKALADAGVGAIVLPSLFEEEIVAEEVGLSAALEAGSGHFAEALDYFPAVNEFTSAVDKYLQLLEEIKKTVEVPVVASLNASSTGGWVRYAHLLAEAGADALELNVYRVPTDPQLNAAQVEELDLALVSNVCDAVSLPVAVKLSPYYSAMAHFAAKVIAAGAGGLVMFNRFYQPDLDLETMDVIPRVELSHSWELRLPLRWIAISAASARTRPVPRRQLRGLLGLRRRKGDCRRRRCGDDDLRPPPPRSRARQPRRVRAALVARRPRLRLSCRASRLGLPGDLHRGERLRAGQLPENTSLLELHRGLSGLRALEPQPRSLSLLGAPSASGRLLSQRARGRWAGRGCR